jgi:hypothetical protein
LVMLMTGLTFSAIAIATAAWDGGLPR